VNSTRTEQALRDVYRGVLLGTAVGDALGLPAENLSPEPIQRRWKGEWRMRLVFGRGMISDDTEHTLLVAQALLSHARDAAAFQRSLGWKLRWWFASLPGGVGLATARACLKLWIGFPVHKAAVVSGGSGPAMRSAIIGAYFADDPERRRAFVLASSRLTHRGWQAETAALAVAECAALAIQAGQRPGADQVLGCLRRLSDQGEWQKLLRRVESSIGENHTIAEFVRTLGLNRGITGYSLHVVPVAIYAWMRHPGDYRKALISAMNCGGDTDTVGAIAGAMLGASVGEKGIPTEWRDGIWEWPRSVAVMERIADRLAKQQVSQTVLGPTAYFWPGVIARNVLFLIIVLAHGFGRLFRPR
jgi:ADP-ribosyl-[dinitrogen reductase] hydrolase